MGLIGWIIGGFVVGLISQWLVKGPHNLGCTGTVALGIIGSLVGGTIWGALSGDNFDLRTGGFLASILGGVIVLVVARLLSGEGRPPRTRRGG